MPLTYNPYIRPLPCTGDRGFTLIEMAVVLLVVTLLLGGLLVPLSTQVQQRKITETQQMLDDIKEALIGYAASHGASGQPYLPCPDVTNDGVEDRYTTGPNTGQCNATRGNLPWVTLGTASADSWGNRFRYQVTSAFSNSDTGFTLTSTGNIQVGTKDSSKNTSSLVTDAPALVMSFGPNGYGAMHEDNNAQAAPPAQNTDEANNTNPSANPGYLTPLSGTGYISRTPSALQPVCSDIKPGEPFCEFDDMITWLSPNILFNRMIAAGRLP